MSKLRGSSADHTSVPDNLLTRLCNQKSMKTLTCRQLGGACDEELTTETWDEMVKAMTKHVMTKHPDVARDMKKLHNEDPNKWGREMKPKWDLAKAA